MALEAVNPYTNLLFIFTPSMRFLYNFHAENSRRKCFLSSLKVLAEEESSTRVKEENEKNRFQVEEKKVPKFFPGLGQRWEGRDCPTAQFSFACASVSFTRR